MNPRTLRLLIVAVLLAGGGSAAALLGGESSKDGAPPSPAASASGPGIRDAVRDGDLEFTVTQVACGASRVGSATAGRSASGQYCFVYLDVRNHGERPMRLPLADQHLFDQAGARFEVDPDASQYVLGSQRLSADIAPGGLVSGALTYDVLASARPTKIELHATPESSGVTVDLTAKSSNTNCITPGKTIPTPSWYPKDLPLPAGSHAVKFDFAPLPNYKQGVFVVALPLTEFVQNVLAEWPKHGWVLGRGDSEPGEAEDTFTKQREQRFGAFRASSGLCDQSQTLAYIVLGSLKAQPTPSPSPTG